MSIEISPKGVMAPLGHSILMMDFSWKRDHRISFVEIKTAPMCKVNGARKVVFFEC
jgi:hypothetical protein